jgi:hypothetical protein
MLDFTVTFEEDGDDLKVHASAGVLGDTEPPREVVRRTVLERLRKKSESFDLADPEDETLVAFGKELFAKTFPEKMKRLYDRTCGSAERRNEALRVVVRFGPLSALHAIPWELLHDGSGFIARQPDSSVVRAFERFDRRRPMQVEGTLRVLLTSASPADLPKLNLAAEEEAIRLAYSSLGKAVIVTPVRDLTLEGLADAFTLAESNKLPFHVWHHSGHGGRTQGGSDFWLSLEGAGRRDPVSIPRLRDVVSVCSELRLVVLNCCHAGSLAGLAPELARLNVPVVIGFPRSIADRTAIRFATVLHRCLTRLPVEHALSLARLAMSPGTREWSLPLLLSRRTDDAGLLARPQVAAASSPPQRRKPAQGGVQLDGVVIGSVGVIGERRVGMGSIAAPAESSVKITGGRIGKVGVIGLEQIASGPSGASEKELREMLSRLDACLERGV